MRINLSSIIDKLSRGEDSLVGEKFMREDMKSIHEFLISNRDLIPKELKEYYDKYSKEFDFFEFTKSYFSIYKKSGKISMKHGGGKSDLIILS